MPTVQSTAPRSNTRGDSLADILERVLDTGIVIAGDIRVQLADIELLTIQIRLIICSVDKAQQLGMDWWKGASFLNSDPLPTPGAAAAKADETESQTPQQLGYDTPATVSSMQEQFGAGAQPTAARQRVQGQQPPRQQGQQGQQPSWQTPGPGEQRPWNQPSPNVPQTGAPSGVQPTQRNAQPAAQPAADAGTRTDASAVQVEMLNERLARLEAVLERLVPPEE